MSHPELFVVCKNCRSEVSPYVTECPYCGQRLRKRAPKLDRGGSSPPSPRRRARLPRLRPGEIAGIAPDVRPYATLALIVASLVVTLVFSADQSLDVGGLSVSFRDEPWRWVTAPFVYERELGYEFVALMVIGVFGSMLERRFGPFAVIAIFLLAGAAGSALAVASDAPPVLGDSADVLGGNGAALGLLTAWLVDHRLAARRGEDRDGDLLGVYVIAAVLVLLSVAVSEANIAAAAGGAAVGALVGPVMPVFTRRAAF
ncbi:MAG: rhomboid family intramembrane serine protease [Thermoleophilaceae bacterium]